MAAMTRRVFSAVVVSWLLTWAAPSAQTTQDKNPLEGNPDAIQAGMGGFRSRCADCHGMDARGVRGPDLTQVWARGRTDEGLFSTVRRGVPGTEMPRSPRRALPIATSGRCSPISGRWPRRRPPRRRGQCRERRAGVPRQCASCHRVNGTGGRLGPDLSRVGIARTRVVLVARIRRGSEDFRAGYEPVTVTTAERPGRPGRQEERRPVLGADHGLARADPGLREGQGARGRERQASRPCRCSDRIGSAKAISTICSRYLATLKGFDPSVKQ